MSKSAINPFSPQPCRENPFVSDNQASLAEVAERERLTEARKRGEMAPGEAEHWAWLMHRARPPIYAPTPPGAA